MGRQVCICVGRFVELSPLDINTFLASCALLYQFYGQSNSSYVVIICMVSESPLCTWPGILPALCSLFICHFLLLDSRFTAVFVKPAAGLCAHLKVCGPRRAEARDSDS
ncbi:hypothetical protein DFH94DRAFT_703705 [Russula ochroleuca]|uniref:Uncharacterized protein n=1 Tax=Russula ochroleuca TaxID=152965 RepID=A0A9P5N672_9AGAM|nr:hypothetical protein DFH94DRAFT_703705 [Russula ochroleuca]